MTVESLDFMEKTITKEWNEFEDFNVGDVVRLKSGGPNMTIDQCGGSRITCVWFEPAILSDGRLSPSGNTNFRRQDFDQGALEKVPAKDTDLSPA